MVAVNRVLGLIPAKGLSTRLARKNLLRLGGKPLLAWTIEAAFRSELIDRVVVSTEDEGVAATAISLGADIPFMRPERLAHDPAGVVDVALHALAELRKQGDVYKTLFILLPTCPFRSHQDIREAYELYRRVDGSSLMSVSTYPHTPLAALKLIDGFLEPYFPEHVGKKSQELPAAFRANGAIHILEVDRFENEKSYYRSPVLGYVMPRERSIDIDNQEDLREAELMVERGRHKA
jgi:CMP-N-acetylneuraminic acid synthetase